MIIRTKQELLQAMRACKNNEKLRFVSVDNNRDQSLISNTTLLGYVTGVDTDKNTIDTTGLVVNSMCYGVHKETGALSEWLKRGYEYDIVTV